MSASNSNNQFSLDRFWLVFRRFSVLHQRNFLIGFLCVAAFNFLLGTFPSFAGIVNLTQTGFSAVQDTAIFFYIWGGLIFTSVLFNEIHTPTQSFQFLTLPATNSEKLFSAWFTSTIAYTVVAMAGIFALSIMIEIVVGITTGAWNPFYIFNPFRPDILNTILSYFFYQSIFLLGAVYFKKNNFIKTLLVITVFVLGALFFFNIGLLIFGLSQNQEFFLNIQIDVQSWFAALKYLTGTVLTCFFIWLSYLQLKNKQVA